MVFMILTYHHLSKPVELLKNLIPSLKPGATVVIVDPDPEKDKGLPASESTLSHAGSDGTMAWVDPANDLFGLVFTQSPGGRNPAQAFQKLITESCVGK